MCTVLLNLSKAFDCIPDGLLAEKFHAYGLSEDTLTLMPKMAWVVDLKLTFADSFIYNLIRLIKLCKLRYLNCDKALLFPTN